VHSLSNPSKSSSPWTQTQEDVLSRIPLWGRSISDCSTDSLVSALEEWDHISKESGVPKAALANLWVAFDSSLDGHKYGDAIVLGVNKPLHLTDALDALKESPLENWIADRIQGIWEKAKHDAPLDSIHG
jgi:aryl-alcohol dehydrogenase-like predicted oxidoreductase